MIIENSIYFTMVDLEDTIPDQSLIHFVKDLVNYEFHSYTDFTRRCIPLRNKYKLSPNKPSLRRTYYHLLKKNQIKENPSFIQFSLKKKTRSTSGVSVITLLTSPTPEYTNSNGERVKQKFSCGENCAYCPNEPEIRLYLTVTSIKSNTIEVSTEEDIHLIRVLTEIIHKHKHYEVMQCSQFTNNTFTIELVQKESLPFQEGETIIGIKGEQPRSYLSTEPAVLRANRNNFDAVLQIYDRADALENCGHIVDKIEILVLGGTWDHYPLGYQEEFIRDIYYGVNTLNTKKERKRLSLEEEIQLSEKSKKRLIGLTLETRPDCVTMKQVHKMRKMNVTRLQLGIQHIDDDVLTEIKRGCYIEDTIKGTDLWKRNGGKVDWHLMPDLPGSSIEKDIQMFQKIFGTHSIQEIRKNYYKYDLKHPGLQADQLKIYPCSTVDWTEIKKWYENGTYKPYSEKEEDLIKVIAYVKNNIFPWIRLNRIIRDIPNQNIIGGNQNVNLRQKLLSREDIHCQCIRCREVKDKNTDISKAELFIREYNGINSTEYFLSYESPDNETLYGFLRLRINHSNDYLIQSSLYDCALIRELHVYGSIREHKTDLNNKTNKSAQHMGFGKKLLLEAEKIVIQKKIPKIAIISGVGVREYYEKNGYSLIDNYMIKNFKYLDWVEIVLILSFCIVFLSLLYDIYRLL